MVMVLLPVFGDDGRGDDDNDDGDDGDGVDHDEDGGDATLPK